MKPILFPLLLLGTCAYFSLAARADGTNQPVILNAGEKPREPAGEEARRLNVLFLISDDLNNNLGCYGDPLAKTPNIDKLAARGVRFERAYCTYPLCGPSRNSFLTGLYPNSSGILGNAQIFRQTIPKHTSLPQAFRHDGYLATRIGKLYHFDVPASIGTSGHDDPASWEVEINPIGVDRLDEKPLIFSLVPNQYGATLSWLASPSPDARHTDGKLAAEAGWMLERSARPDEPPFFLAVGFFRPHTPYVAPKPYFDLYPIEKMPVVTNAAGDQADIPAPALTMLRKEETEMSDDLRRQAVQAYYASTSFVDAQVGRVIDELDRLGLTDNTVIVFTSDHGYLLGEHGLWQKNSLFEASSRVPLLIVAPGISKPGSVVKTPVSLLDLYPTLLELAGVKGPDNLQGQSLVPMLKDPSAAGRGWALTQVRHNEKVPGGGDEIIRYFGYSLRTPRWRYTEWDQGKRGRELYDHDADPKEFTNLADKSEFATTVTDLSQQLREAVKSTFPPDGQTPELPTGNKLWAPVIGK